MSDIRLATTMLDTYLLSHALARFELAHHGYPIVPELAAMADDLVPSYMSRVPHEDPWGRPYVYKPHRVLVRRHPKSKHKLTDSYELTVKLVEPDTGELLPLRIFNGAVVEAPTRVTSRLLALREYPRYPGPASDVRHALTMFGLARPLELVKLAALRVLEDLGERQCLPELETFLRFNEPERLKSLARAMVDRYRADS